MNRIDLPTIMTVNKQAIHAAFVKGSDVVLIPVVDLECLLRAYGGHFTFNRQPETAKEKP